MTISGDDQPSPPIEQVSNDPPQPESPSKRHQSGIMPGVRTATGALLLLVVFALGLASGYLLRGGPPANQTASPGLASPGEAEIIQEASAEQDVGRNLVSLPASYALPVAFGDLGPKLLEAGVIDYDRFVQVYQQAGQPLTEEQLAVLTDGSDAPITMDRSSAYFLLNFFWALGLANQNILLDEGPMQQYSKGDIGSFASTGGWTIGEKPAADIYSSAAIVSLTPEQQARLEEVAAAVYRPCCNNPTSFPDCNHGMAMLGMLELMASQDASTDEMFEAAKYANAFWFPQQSLEMAAFFAVTQDQTFDQVDARQLVGPQFSSSSGFRQMHKWLASNGNLEQAPNSGASCGV